MATLTLLSACGGGSAADDRAQDAPATTAAVDLYDGPDASEHVLVDADLPDGFKAYPFERAPRRADEPPPTVDDGSGICGLRNPADTSDPLDRVQVGYSRRTRGPFVYETVAIYKDEAAAAAVLEQADDAFAACVAGGAQEVPPVSGGPLDVGPFGDGSVAWQVRVQSSDTPTTSVPGMGSSASDMGTGSGEMGMGEGRSGSDMGAGRIGRLYVECGFSHRQVADPIVFPTAAGTPAVTMPMDHAGHGGGGPGTVEGVPGHLHDFFGATTTDGSSTATTLAAGGTTCADPADHSAYWVPTLFDHGTPVEPVRLRAWYGVAPGVDASQVQALPNGLQLIAGDIAATSPQSTSVVGWSCGEEPGGRSAEPPTGCTDDDPLTLQLTFPSCWDGEHLSSSDHRSHVAYPGADGCPASHPVALPEVQAIYDYGLVGGDHDLELAMGGLQGAHGDLVVSWTGDRQEQLLDRCVRSMTDCAHGQGPSGLPAAAHAVAMRKGRTLVMLAVASFDTIDPAFTADMAQRAIEKIPG